MADTPSRKVVIPSGAAKRRSRGILGLQGRGLYRDARDSSTPRLWRYARNDNPLGLASGRDLLHSRAQRVDLRLRPVLPIGDHAADRARVRDVLERIRAQDHEIRDASRLDAA